MNRCRPLVAFLWVGAVACGSEEQTPGPPETGPDLLAAAIRAHDPHSAWPSLRHALVIDQERPDGSTRTATIRLDVPGNAFEYEETTDEGVVRKGVVDGSCFATIDGTQPTEPQREALALDCASVERSRNYYLYLWGLPMKLVDPGTRVDPEIRVETFNGTPTRAIKVTYDADVGTDTWYFYFTPDDHRMVGYRFYHDEAAGDGEYIVLEGERTVAGMRIPRVRRWYTNAEDRFLGQDALVDDQPVAPGTG